MTSNDSRWVAVCRLQDIPVLGARRVARPEGVAGAQVALFRTADDGVHALLDRCPHKAGPLSQGIVSADAVACPLHNWTIGLADGRARAPDEGATPVFRCRVVQGEVQLDADELRQHAVDDAGALPCQRACATA
jgi:nitrite reductase (NADH) small subunit